MKKKDETPLWFGFAFSFALFARDPRAPHPARPRKFSEKYRPREPEATFERKRDTRDFAHFSHLSRPKIKVVRDFSLFLGTERRTQGHASLAEVAVGRGRAAKNVWDREPSAS